APRRCRPRLSRYIVPGWPLPPAFLSAPSATILCNPSVVQTFQAELFQTPLANNRGRPIGMSAAVFAPAQSNTVWPQRQRDIFLHWTEGRLRCPCQQKLLLFLLLLLNRFSSASFLSSIDPYQQILIHAV